ncbi:hypothetical protein SAMN04488543_1002 [Friedmanniella luteola]|uniref:Uncharacterized protein n=1 Tax=Friedmanniella luteola TaxID=546871 RepID=A0A1H1P6A5_9ACTN|nr:hypothetical protein [Friedmanniella luteola]SDS06761.1 hypothetical protein SAMN04488543_1002 [Friedmanniella luteola]
MTRPSEDDRAAFDRAFAEMMAGYHLTAERASDVAAGDAAAAATTTEPPAETPAVDDAGRRWEQLPLFQFPAEDERRPPGEPAEEEPEPYVPEPLPPLDPPALPALLGWLGIGWAALVVLAAAFGARFPSWVGWVAVLGFLGGFAVLVARLPRHRPPGSGDGAVL